MKIEVVIRSYYSAVGGNRTPRELVNAVSSSASMASRFGA